MRARRVHMRRVRTLPGELPGVGRRQGAEPEDDHPADAGRAARRRARRRSSATSTREKVLWQCTTCGACENQCPVGIEHLPILIGSRRGLVSNGDAPEYLGAMYNNLERRSNIWGLGYDQRTKFVHVGGARDVRSRRSTTCWCGSAAPASFDADFQKSLRSLFEILRAQRREVRRAVRKRSAPAIRRSAPATSTCSRSWRTRNIEDLKAAGPKKILTSCPHCVKTIGDDYRKFGYEVEIVHSSVFVEELTARHRCGRPTARRERVTFTTRAISGATPARSTNRATLLDALRRRRSRSPNATATTRTAAAPAADCCSPTRKRSRARASATSGSSSCRPPARTPSSPPARSARSC